MLNIVSSDNLSPQKGYWSNGPRLFQWGLINGRCQYGKEFKANDTIEMRLDLAENKSISYIINGTGFGKAPCVIKENTAYELAIGFSNSGKVTCIVECYVI